MFLKVFSCGNKIKIVFIGIKFTVNLKFNPQKIDKKIKNFSGNKLNTEARGHRIIVSLTSYPERISNIHYTVYSILNQTLKPDKVILYLANEQFPEKENNLPQTLLNLEQNGLEIRWCEDIKSYKKLIPAIKDFPEDIIITADDDIYYQNDWLELLYNAYLKNPEYIHCHTAHKISFENGEILPYEKWQKRVLSSTPSFINFLTGCGGVLYPPASLYKDVLNENLFMRLAPTADDIWFWAMAVLNGTKINIVNNPIAYPMSINPNETEENTLLHINKIKNDEYIKKVLDYYSQLRNIIIE